jgi:hypothetical protein
MNEFQFCSTVPSGSRQTQQFWRNTMRTISAESAQTVSGGIAHYGDDYDRLSEYERRRNRDHDPSSPNKFRLDGSGVDSSDGDNTYQRVDGAHIINGVAILDPIVITGSNSTMDRYYYNQHTGIATGGSYALSAGLFSIQLQGAVDNNGRQYFSIGGSGGLQVPGVKVTEFVTGTVGDAKDVLPGSGWNAQVGYATIGGPLETTVNGMQAQAPNQFGTSTSPALTVGASHTFGPIGAPAGSQDGMANSGGDTSSEWEWVDPTNGRIRR